VAFKPVIVTFNKPVGYVVSKDDKFNKTIYELLPKSWKKDFYYIWRLDKDSNWLLLLTNVPELVNEIEHPSRNIFKIYEVEIDKPIRTQHRDKFKKWCLITEDGEYIQNPNEERWRWKKFDFLQVYDISYHKDSRWRYFVRILLTYGKKRHIRRLLKAFWYRVKKLTRVKFGKYELWNLKPGQYRIHAIKWRGGKKLNII